MPKIIHCSYHKCLTVYYSRVFTTLYNRMAGFGKGYRHFNSSLDDFYTNFRQFKITSINNHALDLRRLGAGCRISRFVRDPRDLVVSGYFYHRRGAEPWCALVDPGEEDWKAVNGHVPEGMGRGLSFAAYLQSLNMEDGLMAEIDFRRNHFASMGAWPVADDRIRVFRYEDLIGKEREVFAELFSFYRLSWPERAIGHLLAWYFSASRQAGRTQHIRNPRTSQWKEHFTPKVSRYFERHFGDLLSRYGYA